MSCSAFSIRGILPFARAGIYPARSGLSFNIHSRCINHWNRQILSISSTIGSRSLSSSRAFSMSDWKHLIRFVAEEDGQEYYGDVDINEFPDVGVQAFEGKSIKAKAIEGSIFDGKVSDRTFTVSKLLSPISQSDVPIIRCLGLNYRDHAIESKMPIPKEPVLFIKPRTALAGPHPAPLIIPKNAQDGTSDYEAELTIVIGKTGKNIPKEDALDYVLGYTAGNDVSNRKAQFANTQWSYSKGFDGAAPVGPVITRQGEIDPHALGIKAIYNGEVVQDSTTKELIFTVQETVSFLSLGTTLEAGTLIMTGTPPGVGFARDPKVVLKHGDDMRVWIEGIGTLINKVHYEE